MKWTYQFDVEASVADIYRTVTPLSWMTFYMPRFYQGVEYVAPGWPAAGSYIVLRYGVGPVHVQMRQTITVHEVGQRLRIREDILNGFWTDTNEISLQVAGNTTKVTVVSDQRSPHWPLAWVGPLRWLTNWLDLPPALRRFKQMIEREALPT